MSISNLHPAVLLRACHNAEEVEAEVTKEVEDGCQMISQKPICRPTSQKVGDGKNILNLKISQDFTAK